MYFPQSNCKLFELIDTVSVWLQEHTELAMSNMACLWMRHIFRRGGAVVAVSVALPESLSKLLTTVNAKQPLAEVTHIALVPALTLDTAEILTGLDWTRHDGVLPNTYVLLQTGTWPLVSTRHSVQHVKI
jgi:hypothetical protein